jgi:hypothetical protein
MPDCPVPFQLQGERIVQQLEIAHDKYLCNQRFPNTGRQVITKNPVLPQEALQ